MPPKLETNGLEDLPTLVSNVETFAWTPLICLNGGKAYADLGVNGWKDGDYSQFPVMSNGREFMKCRWAHLARTHLRRAILSGHVR